MNKLSKKKYYFYLARCNDNTLYSGYTINIKNREAKHNNGTGAKYTKYRKPVKIVYSEEYNNRVDAMRRESQVKNWNKTKKERLITTDNKKSIPR